MKGIGATSILQKFKTLHEESKIGVPQKVSVLPELCHAKEDNAWLNEEGNLLARVLLILIDEGHDVPIAVIMEVLTQMLKFEQQDSARFLGYRPGHAGHAGHSRLEKRVTSPVS